MDPVAYMALEYETSSEVMYRMFYVGVLPEDAESWLLKGFGAGFLTHDFSHWYPGTTAVPDLYHSSACEGDPATSILRPSQLHNAGIDNIGVLAHWAGSALSAAHTPSGTFPYAAVRHLRLVPAPLPTAGFDGIPLWRDASTFEGYPQYEFSAARVSASSYAGGWSPEAWSGTLYLYRLSAGTRPWVIGTRLISSVNWPAESGDYWTAQDAVFGIIPAVTAFAAGPLAPGHTTNPGRTTEILYPTTLEIAYFGEVPILYLTPKCWGAGYDMTTGPFWPDGMGATWLTGVSP